MIIRIPVTYELLLISRDGSNKHELNCENAQVSKVKYMGVFFILITAYIQTNGIIKS